MFRGNSWQRLLHAMLFVGLALRVVIPAGLMPTDTADGWFLQLCPGQHAAELTLSEHHQHGDGPLDSGLFATLSYCWVGAGFDQSTLEVVMAVPASIRIDTVDGFFPTAATAPYAVLHSLHQPRGPPIS